MRETLPQLLPVSLTTDAITAVQATGLEDALAAQEAIFTAAYAERDAHPKWELFTIYVHGVTLQMRAQPVPCARLLVTID